MTMTTLPAPAPTLRETIRKKGWQWPMMIVFLLAIPVVAHMYLLWKVTHDSAFAIEKDYYKKALSWDATMAQTRANTALGWHATVTPQPTATGVDVAVVLDDAQGQRVAPTAVHVDGFFLGRSSDQQAQDATLGADGRWHAVLPLPHAGLHEFRLTVKRGTDTFTSTHRLDVAR